MASQTEHHAFHSLRQLVNETSTCSTNASSTNQSAAEAIAPFATALNGVNISMNNIFRDALWGSLGALAVLILLVRMGERLQSHLRHLMAMSVSGQQQTYWTLNRTSWWKVKKHLLYAPLWKKRHNREIRLSSAISMGTLPSRFHTLLLSAYVISNIVYCAWLDYGKLDKYSVVAQLRGISGDLAVVNMIPLVIFAGRNNPLISLLQVSFDTYNLLHRWMGRVVVLEVFVHTAAWAYVKYAATGWSGIGSMIIQDPFITWGTVGTIVMLVILLSSPSPVRHAFYETFLDVHIILACVLMLAVVIHCELGKLPQRPYIWAAISLWLGERIARMVRIVYCNYSRKGWTNASVEALPGDACRVILHLPKYIHIKPGTHAYLRFSSINPWESHPFSIAWVDHRPRIPVLPSAEKDLESQDPMRIDKSNTITEVSFIIQAQTGLTRRLFNKARVAPRTLPIRAALEGPYAGHHSLDSYGHVVLFAGSSGITHQLPYIRHLLHNYSLATVATRRILLVWIIRDIEQLTWVRPWMDTLLQHPHRRAVLTLKIFITRPRDARQLISPSATVQLFPGRPNVQFLLKNEVRNRVGAMCVTVCGPGGLADNVREVVREVQEEGVVDFIEESFTW
jgi:NAD(P)H-flavin reductase